MKKTFTKKFIASILILSSLACVLMLTGCSNDQTFVEQNYISNTDNINSIVINVEDRDISVGISNDNQIHIEYFESEKEFYDISTDNSTLSMTIKYDKSWTDYIGSKPSISYRKINISIPNNMLDNLTITTTNENINLSTLSVLNSISLDANGGNINLTQVSVGNNINLTAKNGNINGSIVGSWNDFAITCEIKKGDTNLPENKTDGEKTLNVNCNNGDVNIDFIS